MLDSKATLEMNREDVDFGRRAIFPVVDGELGYLLQVG